MSIKAILWDFGGVLTSSPFEAFNAYEKRRGIPKDFIRKVNSKNHLNNAWARFESNKIDLEQFDREFLQETNKAGFPISGREVTVLLGGDLRPRMVSALKLCAKHYKIGCLTNNANAGTGSGMSNSQIRASAVAEVMALFDVVVESSKEGIRKPNPEIYHLACQRLKVSPTEVIYLDDLGINLKPARVIGMLTIKVISEEQAIADLADASGLNIS